MKNFQLLLIMTGIAGFLYGCNEPESWNDIADSVPPGTVRNVKVVNLSGGAQITYELPDDDDLLGVKAVYSFADRGEEEVFSSAQRDTILLQGYNSTDENIVKLIVVDKSWNESEPVEVKIKPLTPPIALIRQSIRTNPTFGGVYAQWDNPFNEELAVSLYTLDSLGDYQLFDSYYSAQENGKVSFRGLENTRQQFRIEFRDKWNNYSEPFDTILTPLFEEEIVGRDQSGNIWSRWGWDNQTTVYRGDINVPDGLNANQTFATLHDGNLFNNNRYWNPFPANRLGQYIDWPDPEHMVLPMYFIIDMGKQAAYSRLRIWMRDRAPLFSGPIMTRFEVWGTNDPKPLEEIGDGSKEANLRYWTAWPEVGGTNEWQNDWVRLVDAELKLPSGQTDPSLLTNEDHEFIRAGFEFEVDPQYAASNFRYLRFVIKETNYNNEPFIQVCELKFWGAYETD